jgi:hypothetical protein
MLRITLRISYDRRVVIVLASLILVLLLSGSIPAAGPGRSVSASPMAIFILRGNGRHVYVTTAYYFPAQALSACASPYHMASFWEIMDVSNLIYDYDHPDAATQSDSGSGPPSEYAGWVRTGYSSSGSNTAGTGNCYNWTSSSASSYGTVAKLTRQWETAPSQADLWDFGPYPCNLSGRVWCVRHAYIAYLPLIVRDD